MHRLEIIGEPERRQRRDSFRLPVTRHVDIWTMSEIIGGQLDLLKIDARTGDISETGMLVNTDHNLQINEIVNCDISLSDEDTITAKAEILRTVLPDTNGQPIKVGMRFVEMQERAKRILLRFILQEQVLSKSR